MPNRECILDIKTRCEIDRWWVARHKMTVVGDRQMPCLLGQTSELANSEGWVVQTTDMRDPYCQRSQRKESKRRIEMKHARQHLHDAVLDQTMLENRKEKLILTKHPNIQEPIIQLIIPTSQPLIPLSSLPFLVCSLHSPSGGNTPFPDSKA